MSLQDPSTYTPADIANPALDDATLRHIAQYRPDLRGFVLQHPSCSPALAQLIHASAAPQQAQAAPGVPAVPQAPAGFNLGQAAVSTPLEQFGGHPQQFGQHTPQTPQPAYGQPSYGQPGYAQAQYAQGQPAQHPQAVAWAQWFQQTTGRQPAAADYRSAVAAGHLPHDALRGLSGAALPAGLPAHLGALGKMLLLVPLGALIAIIGTFLPVVSISAFGESFSFNYWVADADGPIILVCSVLAVVAAAVAIVKPAKWSYILAGVIAIVSQLLLFVSAFAAFVNAADLDIPLGPAPFIVLLGAIIVTIGAIFTLVSARKL